MINQTERNLIEALREILILSQMPVEGTNNIICGIAADALYEYDREHEAPVINGEGVEL